MSGTRYNQFCALARAAEIVGERWTLLIVRELLLNPMRFADLRARLDNVSPALLTARLNALMETGVVQRKALPAPFNAQVYELTEIGRALQPAIRELIRWGGRFLLPMRKGGIFEPDWVLLALEAVARRTAVPACRIGLRIPHANGIAEFLIEGGAEGTRISKGDTSGIATIEASFDVVLQVLAKQLSIDTVIEKGVARTEGSAHTLRKLPRLFELATTKR